ncbi:MAG: putative toxin-antitoxin system toxin component, PIN family [Streptosporangiaceae bacterium]
MDSLRAVIDPNVWISALISPSGAPADVLRAVLAGEVTAIATPHLLEEVAEVLYRDKLRRWVSLSDAEGYVAALADKVELRPEAGKPSKTTRDPDDDYLVALAEQSGAVIVTGDGDLLSMDLHPPAMTPRALLDWLRSHR